MRIVTQPLIFALSALVWAAGCSSSTQAPEQTSEPKTPAVHTPKKNIVFLGTSLTAGYGLDVQDAYPNVLQQRIDSLGLPYHCVNAGVSGETTAGGLRRIGWLLSQPVDVLVIELGANDMLRGIPLSDTRKNLMAIVDSTRLRYPQCQIALAGMKGLPNLGARYVNEFEGIYPAVAQEKQLTLIPFLLDGVAGQTKLNQADGIHPTTAGQRILAQNVWQTLQPLLTAR